MAEPIYGIDPDVMEPGLDPSERGYPGFKTRQVTYDGLTIKYDLTIPLGDGVTSYTDVYRPAVVRARTHA